MLFWIHVHQDLRVYSSMTIGLIKFKSHQQQSNQSKTKSNQSDKFLQQLYTNYLLQY